jgi:hypothetical protein
MRWRYVAIAPQMSAYTDMNSAHSRALAGQDRSRLRAKLTTTTKSRDRQHGTFLRTFRQRSTKLRRTRHLSGHHLDLQDGPRVLASFLLRTTSGALSAMNTDPTAVTATVTSTVSAMVALVPTGPGLSSRPATSSSSLARKKLKRPS